MATPTYNAYKPVLMTDGVERWEQGTFDATVPFTADDANKCMEMMSGLSSFGRIEKMKKRLAALENITPSVRLHVDAIRKIHADYLAKKQPVTRADEDALDKQADHWLRIRLTRDVLPVVREAAANKAKRKANNTATAKMPRPNGRTTDHEKILVEFDRLLKGGHTLREARGILFMRELGSRSTVYRVTKK